MKKLNLTHNYLSKGVAGALLMAMACAPAVWAQTTGTDDELENSGKVHFTKTDSQDKEILSKDRPVGPNSVPTPKFVIKTENRAFMMTIGGQVNPILGWDIGNNLYEQGGAGINFVTQAIPVPSRAGHKGDFYLNALNAMVDFQVVGFGGTENQVTGYIKLGTNGINNQIALSKAYVTYRNFTAGLKHTLMQDGYACQPPTIDPEGPCGELSTNVYELSYTSPNYNGFQWALGIDIPTFDSSNGVYRGKDFPVFDGKQVADYGDAEQMVPDIPAWIQYGTSNYNRIRLSGILRNFAYRDLVQDKTRHQVGYGVMLSGNLNPVDPFIIYLQVAYGKGIGTYLQDLSGLPYSFIPNPEKPGEMKASPMMGFNFGFTYNINKKWQVNLMGSESRIWQVGAYANALEESQNYKYALYGAGNIFYNINSYLQVGLEYLYGRRVTWNNMGANDSRIQMQFMFTI